MKKFALTLLLTIAAAGISFHAAAQNKISIRYFEQFRMVSQLSYNFFTGKDAADFTTSINGFGSGILDFFGTRSSLDILTIGTDKLFVSAGVGFAVTKYRLSKNLILGQSNDNTLTWAPDQDTSHNYVNTFFGFGKSKIITTSFYFPVDLNLAVGKNVMVSAGGYLDLNLTARYKMKYLEGEDKVTEIIRSSEFRKFNPSTAKVGVNVSFFHKKKNFGLSASYSLTPFFKPGTGPDIHEVQISGSYAIRDLKSQMREKEL